VDFDYDGHAFTLIDTAGMRRRGKVEPGIEKYSILRTMQSVDEADVCVVMVDFSEGVMNQDAHVCEYILEKKRGLILVANKVDAIDADEREQAEHMFIHALKDKMAFLPWAPLIFTSALERRNVFNVLEIAMQIQYERNREIPKQDLAVWFQMAIDKHPPRGMRGKHKFSILGVKQDGIQPPTFVFSCNWPEIMHFSYSRYLENELRGRFGFIGTPIRFVFRTPEGRGGSRRT
jgi:GTP-binding protein